MEKKMGMGWGREVKEVEQAVDKNGNVLKVGDSVVQNVGDALGTIKKMITNHYGRIIAFVEYNGDKATLDIYADELEIVGKIAKIVEDMEKYFAITKFSPDREDRIGYVRDALEEDMQDVTYEYAEKVFDEFVAKRQSTEVGVMENGTDKNLYMRAVHSTITISSGTVVTYEITVTFSQE
ncbi:hypothetical protein LCGC14_2632600 [marine sediment metagenome]|uniref:Uncharacterized protein n=1 Tax=marine sediment metagenome TaxID=412755 RepID=A0A0F9CSB9_9ZZZZ